MALALLKNYYKLFNALDAKICTTELMDSDSLSLTSLGKDRIEEADLTADNQQDNDAIFPAINSSDDVNF